MPAISPPKELAPGKKFGDFRLKKPELNLEHINRVSELSSLYLPQETKEFSEDDLVANMYALFQISKAQNSKMKKEHAEELGKLMLSTLELETKRPRKE